MIQHKIYGLITASVILSMMSGCSDDANVVNVDNTDNSGVISFTINSEAGQPGTRGDKYKSDYTDCFSDGSTIDMLLFAVYSKPKDSSDPYQIDGSFYKPSQIDGINRRDQQQNVIAIDKFPISVNLIPDQSKEYRIVFWAQNRYCSAYKTEDLTQVQVDYIGALANDPTRDAFWTVIDFKGEDGGTHNVILTRPFTQINVGTSGWDYEGKAILQPNPEVMKYSSLKVSGVSSKFNALDGTVERNNLQTVTFEYNVIPAYVEADAKNLLDEIDSDYIEAQSKNHFDSENNSFTSLFDEVYLKVNVDKDEKEKYNDYIGWYEYKDKTDKFFAKNQGTTNYDEQLSKELLTEQFKYLATCYVLVPCILNEETDELQGSTCDVTFECKSALPTGTPQPSVEADNVFSFTLNSVPVNRNWRTNIVSKAGSALFMNASQFKVDVYPEEYGDYYKRAQATDSNWSDGVGSGENENGDYHWPFDDIESSVSLTLDNIQLQVGSSDNDLVDYGDVDQRYVDLIKYMDRDKKLKITISPRKMLAYTEIAKYIEAGKMSYEYSLGGNQKGTDIITENNIDFTVNVNDLLDIYDKYEAVTIPLTETETLYSDDYKAGDKPVTNQVADRFYLKYYPIEFRVKTILSALDDKDEAYKDFNPDDLVVTLRVYTSYKFTFSSDSQDEGKDIFAGIQKQVHLGTDSELTDEKNSYYVVGSNGKVESTHLKVEPRSGTANNDRLYAINGDYSDIGDHLRFRGAHINGNSTGHYVILKTLKENCKITVKLGRDKGVDNSSAYPYDVHNRGLHINWDPSKISKVASGDDSDEDRYRIWKGITPNTETIETKLDQKTSEGKTTYKHSESKILTGKNTEISDFGSGKDVTLYVDKAGHSYYWIILSETDTEGEKLKEIYPN